MKINIDKHSVGLRIKNIRLKLTDTLEQFGKRFNADKSNILRWEQGKTLPNKQRLSFIAKLGGLTLNQLLYGSINEFLENNIEELVKESDYPIDLKDSKLSEQFKKEVLDYILFSLKEYSNYQQGKNPLENIDFFSSKASSFVSEYIYNDIDMFLELFSQYSRETGEVLKIFHTKEDIERFNISSETLEKLTTVDNLISYLACINEDGITEDY